MSVDHHQPRVRLPFACRYCRHQEGFVFGRELPPETLATYGVDRCDHCPDDAVPREVFEAQLLARFGR